MILAVVGVFAGVLLLDGWRMVGLALDLGMEVYLIPIYENLFERSNQVQSGKFRGWQLPQRFMQAVAYSGI